MTIKPGTIAPFFEFDTLDGKKVLISDYLTQGKRVLLSFHRFGACPICNLHIRSLINNQKRLEEPPSDLQILVVFESSLEVLKASVAHQEPPFPIAADPSGHSYKLFGVKRSTIGLLRTVEDVGDVLEAKKLGLVPEGVNQDGHADRMPADFVIDLDGRVLTSHYGKHAGDHLSLAKILEVVNTVAPTEKH